MRAIAIILALLAGAKVWTQESLYRQATREALIAAYRDRAIEACEKVTARSPLATRHGKPSFTRPAQIDLVIGKSGVDVNVWDVDNVLWPMRFKFPYVMVASAEGTARAQCEYDVTLAAAEIKWH